VEEKYERLLKQGFHSGVLQSIEPLRLSDDGRSTLGQIFLNKSLQHSNDSFYCAHPDVSDVAFQLIGFLIGPPSEASSMLTSDARITACISLQDA